MRRNSQRGVTLVELMIAILIGLFLMGGLLTLVSAMKRTSTIQGSLSLLHDSERLAMSLATDVIQSAGYFPYPIPPGSTTALTSMPVVVSGAPVLVAGQSIFGTDGGAANAELDTVSVRYLTAGGDGIINCTGGTSTTKTIWISTFQLDALGNFNCVQGTETAAGAVTSAAVVTLVSGVKYLTIRYGVQSNSAATTPAVDCYLTASQVQAASLWGNVMSVQITLTLTNPLKGQPGSASASTPDINFTRVIALMSKVGLNT